MEAIEFKAKIKNGVIQIPEKYKNKIGKSVKVIVMSENITKQNDIIEDLFANPIKVKSFKPLSREDMYERLQ